mmetsp:Transcript_27717/g.73215  ORF Transcript_27717/g.73215 Transcript_27717/m.73215 type:complete len:454 (+) Transcript_27717:27-1388(+)
MQQQRRYNRCSVHYRPGALKPRAGHSHGACRAASPLLVHRGAHDAAVRRHRGAGADARLLRVDGLPLVMVGRLRPLVVSMLGGLAIVSSTGGGVVLRLRCAGRCLRPLSRRVAVRRLTGDPAGAGAVRRPRRRAGLRIGRRGSLLRRVCSVLLLRDHLLLLLHLQGPPVGAALLLLLSEDVVVEALAVVLDGELGVVVDGDRNRALEAGLVLRVVELHAVRMPHGVLRRDPLGRVEHHAEAHEVQGLHAGAREHLVQGPRPAHRQRLEHRGRERRLDRLHVLRGGSPGDLHDAVQLVHGGGSWEDRLPRDELSHDTAHAPDVDALRIRGGAEEDLRGAVPARCDIVSQHRVLRIVVHLHDAPCQAKVADLHLAVGVQQDVRGLDVTVEHLPGVHVLQRLEQLVDDVLLVDLLEDLGADDRVQVGLHEVADQIDVLVIVGLEHVQQPHNVLVSV